MSNSNFFENFRGGEIKRIRNSYCNQYTNSSFISKSASPDSLSVSHNDIGKSGTWMISPSISTFLISSDHEHGQSIVTLSADLIVIQK